MKLETEDSDKLLVKMYEKFMHVAPENLGIDEYFSLN